MPQVVEFEVEGEWISTSARDAVRLVESLRARRSEDCMSAADKIAQATRLHEDTTVRLAIGEDECVLQVLKELRATGDFLNSLARLERAIQGKLDREG